MSFFTSFWFVRTAPMPSSGNSLWVAFDFLCKMPRVLIARGFIQHNLAISIHTHTTRTHTHSNAHGDICPSKWKTHSENCVLGYFLWMVGHQHQCRHFLLPSSFKCTSGIKSVLLAGNYMQNAFLPSPVVHDAARLDHCLWACVFYTCRHRQCEEYSALLTIKIDQDYLFANNYDAGFYQGEKLCRSMYWISINSGDANGMRH